MKLGQKVVRIPETFFDSDPREGKANRHPITGRVVYIHPRCRYHTVEFDTRGGSLRESFQGVAD